MKIQATEATIRENIRSCIQNLINSDSASTLQDDTDLLDMGLLDSLGILEIVAFLEESFAIQIPDVDITPDNFCSIDALCTYLRKESVE